MKSSESKRRSCECLWLNHSSHRHQTAAKQAKRDRALIDFKSTNRPKRKLRRCQTREEHPVMTEIDLDDGKEGRSQSLALCYVAPWRPHGISEHSVKASCYAASMNHQDHLCLSASEDCSTTAEFSSLLTMLPQKPSGAQHHQLLCLDGPTDWD